MTDCVVLMYHRVCERSPNTECYFARGTAVEPDVFAHQVEWLSRHTEVVSIADWLASSWRAVTPGTLPVAALSFDDGYRDCLQVVAPICAAAGLPWTMFCVAACTSPAPALLWTDFYYALLSRARRRQRIRLPREWTREAPHSPGLDDNLTWWVRGAPKQALARMDEAARAAALEWLASELDAGVDESQPASGLYCTLEEAGQLVGAGVTVGGHGRRHVRLADVSSAECDAEIDASVRFLDRLGIGRPRLFAYPDGSCDPDVACRVREAGFDGAFTVEPGWATSDTDRFAIPRHIVRNLRPSDPRWCAGLTSAHFRSGAKPC